MNMDYCKFENTANAMRQIAEELDMRMQNDEIDCGATDEYGDIDTDDSREMSSCEKNGMIAILQMALDIVENAGGTDELYEMIENAR